MKIFETWNLPGDLNMALDVELGKLSYDLNEPVLRFYTWEKPTLSLGKHQRLQGINWDFVRAFSIPCVRRPTGGRGVFHHKELTYSISVPKGHALYKLKVTEMYSVISRIIVDSLRAFGLNVKMEKGRRDNTPFCFKSPSIHEITLNGRKLVGSAQLRTEEYVLQHGSIILDYDEQILASLFNLSVDDIERSIIGVWNVTFVPFERIVDGLRESFERFFGMGERKELSGDVVKRAMKRAKEFVVYGSDGIGETLSGWNAHR